MAMRKSRSENKGIWYEFNQTVGQLLFRGKRLGVLSKMPGSIASINLVFLIASINSISFSVWFSRRPFWKH